jgi:hypothetical protein
MDGRRFAGNFKDALLGMYQAWVNGKIESKQLGKEIEKISSNFP